MELDIRTLTCDEVGTLIDWAAEEGWNPGLSDSVSFYAADPEGFLGGFLDGQLVTGISGVRYGDDFGFIGLFITRPDLRHQGYGRAIWNAAIDRLNGCTIGLDGVPEQQGNYQNKGFVYDYGTTRYSGTIAQDHRHLPGIEPVEPASYSQIYQLDRLYFPAERQRFLESWLNEGNHAFMLKEDDVIRGFGVARKCRDGYKIGPLCADHKDVATSILLSLGAASEGTVHIDVPDHQEEFIPFLTSMGMMPGFSTARMYRGKAPDFTANGVYGVTSLELG